MWASIEAVRGGAVTRRAALRVGCLGLLGLSLEDLLRIRAAAEGTPAASRHPRSVIHVFLGGGPSHIDLYDPKPFAPSEVRGEFGPISSRVPGIELSELLPRLADEMPRLALVRSMAHSNSAHLPASHWMMTGHNPPAGTTSNVNPAIGAVVARARGSNRHGMPAYVSIPKRQLLGASAYLGPACNPFTPESDPVSAKFAVQDLRAPKGLDLDRVRSRGDLRARLDRFRADLDRQGQSQGIDRFARAALEMVLSAEAQQAFEIEQEPAALRERYGMTSAGQRCLLARRLVEAGVTFVTVLSGGQWDTHRDNFATMRESTPPVDQAIAALVADLDERGLSDEVLLLVSGEFGRTPKINPLAGRDHWPGAFSVLLAGGGLRRGIVIGSTDRTGAQPTTHPYSPGDLLATIYQFLDIDQRTIFYDRSNRPVPILPEGTPIAELFG